MSNLTLTHLTFDCIAETPIHLDHHWAGNRLRGALGYILLNTTCTQPYRQTIPTPEHAATCPACWLLSHKLDPAHARRAYSIVPPIPSQQIVHPGRRFSFTITLYGDGWQFLPYFVLAVSEMGRTGVGGRPHGQRGTFQVASITARNPLTQQEEVLLAPGADYVQVPTLNITWQDTLNTPYTIHNSQLTINFLTPTRLIHHKRLMKQPNFAVFFRRLLHRIDTLGTQFAAIPRRPVAECTALDQIAQQVQTIHSAVEWIELRPRSGRDRQHKPISGFVGQATYRAVDWQPLLPLLLLGQGVQVGKSTTKGNGVYQLGQPTQPYWSGTSVANQHGFETERGLRNSAEKQKGLG